MSMSIYFLLKIGFDTAENESQNVWDSSKYEFLIAITPYVELSLITVSLRHYASSVLKFGELLLIAKLCGKSAVFFSF